MYLAASTWVMPLMAGSWICSVPLSDDVALESSSSSSSWPPVGLFSLDCWPCCPGFSRLASTWLWPCPGFSPLASTWCCPLCQGLLSQVRGILLPVALKLLVAVLSLGSSLVVRTWSRLSEGALEIRSDVPRGVLVNVALASHLGQQGLVLLLIPGKPPTKLVQQQRQLVRMGSHGSQNLKGRALDAHNEASFICCSLSDDFVAGQKGVDVLPRPASEGKHLRHTVEPCLLLEIRKSGLKCAEEVSDWIEYLSISDSACDHLLR